MFVMLWVSTPIHAASLNWSGTIGDWSDSANWSGIEPTSNDIVFIGNGGTAYISQFGEECNILYLGQLGTGKTGSVQMVGGTFAATSIFDGYYGVGTFTHSAGTNTIGYLYVGYNASGSYFLSDTGELSASTEVIGILTGTGLFQQTGGTNSARYISIGTKGQYKFSDGTLLISGGLDNGGVLDFEGGSAVINATDNTIINLALSGGSLTIAKVHP